MEKLVIYLAVPVFVSLTYFAIGVGINRNNARYLLAGYNTMNEEKRRRFDIEKYLRFFRSFFKKLSIFALASWIFLALFFERETAVIMWTVLQILPFIVLIKKSTSSSQWIIDH